MLTRSYSAKDSELVNLRYVAQIVKYFDSNLLGPFRRYLADNVRELVGLRRRVRVKLLVFLVKTKVCTRFIANCASIRRNDFLHLPPAHPARFAVESQITFVCLGERRDCAEGYRRVGDNIRRLIHSLLATHGARVDWRRCLEHIRDPDYLDNVVTPGQVEQIRAKLRSMRLRTVSSAGLVLRYLRTTVTPEVADRVELSLCFPEAELCQMYFQLIGSKLATLGARLAASSVGAVRELFVPLSIFESEFRPNTLFPRTRVRTLGGGGFLEKVSPQFLVQPDFLSKQSLSQSMQRQHYEQFERHLRQYAPFDRNASASQPSTGLPKRFDLADTQNDALKLMRIVMFSPAKVRLGASGEQPEALRRLRRVVIAYHGGGFISMNTDNQRKLLRWVLGSSNGQ